MQKQLLTKRASASSFSLLKLFLMVALVVTAFDSKLHGQILNESFENWADCIPDDWSTPNVCGLVTPVARSSNAADGTWALRGEVVSFVGTALSPIVQSGADATGFPIAERYGALEGMFMFSPKDGDRFTINVGFFKGETVVAQGAIAISTNVSEYTSFIVPMNYFTSDVPDKAIIAFDIIGPTTGSDYHVGSVMYVDALSFTEGPEPQPVLSIERIGNQVLVSWPAEVTGYRLQSTPRLDSPNWTEVSGVAENKYQFTPTSQEFFRLIKP